jgi:hypothetical protein
VAEGAWTPPPLSTIISPAALKDAMLLRLRYFSANLELTE